MTLFFFLKKSHLTKKKYLKTRGLVCSPDERGKPFEIELLIFPDHKERPAEAPLCSGKSNCMKKLETASRKQLPKQK
ncbi:hypothetical protein FBFR_13600 [Flavobacterium fryxellicola]|uniref:Uncharacterized protein n=1 Tax=Flavobacterium fryxellicola TaxID=249352 RepID=A0A162NYN0_9FLAO|nr:hypothetical protein FBFR_13600 [Flavobacterium fryxellicola]